MTGVEVPETNGTHQMVGWPNPSKPPFALARKSMLLKHATDSTYTHMCVWHTLRAPSFALETILYVVVDECTFCILW